MHSSFSRLIRTFSKPAWAFYFNLSMAVSVSGGIILPSLLFQHWNSCCTVCMGAREVLPRWFVSPDG